MELAYFHACGHGHGSHAWARSRSRRWLTLRSTSPPSQSSCGTVCLMVCGMPCAGCGGDCQLACPRDSGLAPIRSLAPQHRGRTSFRFREPRYAAAMPMTTRATALMAESPTPLRPLSAYAFGSTRAADSLAICALAASAHAASGLGEERCPARPACPFAAAMHSCTFPLAFLLVLPLADLMTERCRSRAGEYSGPDSRGGLAWATRSWHVRSLARAENIQI